MEIKHKKKKEEQVEKIHNKAEYTNYDLWATIHFVMYILNLYANLKNIINITVKPYIPGISHS